MEEIKVAFRLNENDCSNTSEVKKVYGYIGKLSNMSKFYKKAIISAATIMHDYGEEDFDNLMLLIKVNGLEQIFEKMNGEYDSKLCNVVSEAVTKAVEKTLANKGIQLSIEEKEEVKKSVSEEDLDALFDL